MQDPGYRDLDPAFMPLYEACRACTMTSIERMYALYKVVEHTVRAGIPGDLAECGVWKGGSMMMCALTLRAMKDTSRTLYLYDTFEGMTLPTEKDADVFGDSAEAALRKGRMREFGEWCRSPLDEVRANLLRTGYPPDKIVFVRGRVEETLPATRPRALALLRLDTDWYESTYHELTHLYPLLTPGGVLIVDDYGHWRGAREATDRYLEETGARMLLHRVDYTGRVGVKGAAA